MECVVCQSKETRETYAFLRECVRCGHIFADIDLSQEKFQDLYDASYFCGSEYKDYAADRAIHEKNFALRLKILKKFLDPQRHKHLLEIGCAYGFFLDTVKDRFESVTGTDICEGPLNFARAQLNLNVFCGDFTKLELGHHAFDVVCLWDTLEHLGRPDQYLKKIKEITTSGALLAFTTGDINSFNARWQKERWRLIHPPTHAHYFSKKTLQEVLDRFDFEILYARYCGFFRSFDEMTHGLFVLKWNEPRLYRFFGNSFLRHWKIYLNLYDILYVIAKRR